MNRRRWIAGAAGLALLVGLAAAPPVQPSEAAFTDSEVAAASFTAASLAPPQISAVTNCTGLLGLGLANGVTMRWSFPANDAYSGFTPAANAQWAFNNTGDNWQTATTTVVSPGVYQTTFNTGLISDLLALLVGGEMTFRVRTAVGDNWTSATSSTVTFHNLGGGVLGLSPWCSAPTNGA